MEHHYLDQEIECASREDMRKVQSERLRTMVKNAYDHVPFYKEKLDELGIKPEDIQSIDDITKLPFTFKTDLRDHYPFGLFAVGKEDLARIHASSGTTGKPTVVGYTKNDLDVWARCIARGLTSVGMTKADTMQVAYGYGLFTGGLGFHEGAGYMGMTVIPASSGNTNRQIAMLQDYGTDMLCCTPSYAMYLGETVREMGIDPKTLPIRAAFCGAEPWTEEMRKELEKLLAIKAYDVYGLSEISGPGVAMECSEQCGMHIAEDYFYPEIIDPDTGEVLEDGQYGELVFTCIGKEALPLIRYRTRDICKLERSACKCGRTTVRMMKPHGRTDDMLIIRGINVFPSQIEAVLLSLGMEPNYQMIVDRKDNRDSLEVQIEMAEEMFSDTMKDISKAEKRISEALKSTLNIMAKVRLLEPKTLPRSEGKAKRVIDNRNL